MRTTLEEIEQNAKSVPHQDETPRYEKPAVKKIGNMSSDTAKKHPPVSD